MMRHKRLGIKTWVWKYVPVRDVEDRIGVFPQYMTHNTTRLKGNQYNV